MQLYSNAPGPVVRQCPKCQGWFRLSNTVPGLQLACAVMHYGDGCCHHGDTEVEAPVPADPEG